MLTILKRYSISFLLVGFGHHLAIAAQSTFGHAYDFRLVLSATALLYWLLCCWVSSCVFELLDRSPSLRSRKLRPNGAEVSFRQLVPVALRNEFLTCIGGVLLFPHTDRVLLLPLSDYSLGNSLLWIIAYALLYDVVFYFAHRLQHDLTWLKSAHKLHHLSLATKGVSHHYMSLLDFFLEVFLPGLLPALLLGLHGPAFTGFLGMGGYNGVCVHSGYDFACCPDPRDHFWHHVKHSVNYALGPCDKLCGTYEAGAPALDALRSKSQVEVGAAKTS